jgi:hypothetical protein
MAKLNYLEAIPKETWDIIRGQTAQRLSATPGNGQAKTSAPQATPPRTWSAAELLDADFPEPPWIVPGLLPVGLTLLAGRPKVGKSWLALQLMQAVATGGNFLGQRVQRGACLYLALEDSPRRLQSRMRAQGWTARNVQADFVTVGQAGDLLPLNGKQGGALSLAEMIASSGYRLVVIDTLSRALNGDQNAADVMTAALAPLQEAAHTLGCAVVVVDHFNKLGAANPYSGGPGMEVGPDPVLNVLGSTAKAAMADAILGLYKAQGKAGAVLAVTGRDVEEKQLLLKQDPLTHSWQCEGDADAIRVSDARRQVWEAVKELGETTCTELAEILGRGKGPVLKDLVRLVNDGLLFRDGNTFRATQPEGVSKENEGKFGNLGNLETLETLETWKPHRSEMQQGFQSFHQGFHSGGRFTPGVSKVSRVSKVSTPEMETGSPAGQAQPPSEACSCGRCEWEWSPAMGAYLCSGCGREHVPTTTASVPVMITRRLRQRLLDAGYSESAIDRMTPHEAWQVVGDG